MCAVQEAPDTRKSNTNDMDRQLNAKYERYKLVKREVLEKATDGFIRCLFYRQMWDYYRRCKTAGQVKNWLEL